MQVRLLGPVEAWSAGLRVNLGPRQQRLVLAVLALEANKLVPVDRLVDLIWDSPPASARATVQVLVSRLRAAFRGAGPDGPEILNRRTGYLLQTDPLSVDAHRFTELTARARAAGGPEAVSLFDEALGLWRGDPLADVATPQLRDRLCGGLSEARLTAVEDRLDARLRLGEFRLLLDELTELVAQHPGRPRPMGQLMLVLHRQGRTSDALEAFRAQRARLADELGLDPAPELRELESAILRADPALLAAAPATAPVRPAELPHAAGFAGREGELAVLDAGAGSGIWVISGTAGVGKTALAVHWSHSVRDRFPDGQLYADLRGFDPEHEPLSPSAVLAQLLRGLGADPRAVPSDLDGQAKLYRTLTADRHVLVLLDNARDAAQVVPLLPAAGTVLVTSRSRLGDLVVRAGARPLPLDVLPAADSLRLLAVALGPNPVAAEPEAAAELARLCGHLPLALRIAAANLRTGPAPEIGQLVKELAQGDALAELAVDGAETGGVAIALSSSYRALAAEQRLLFRRLGLIPGPTFTPESAAAVAGLPGPVAGRRLRGLAAAHLIERHTGNHYRCHDLLRQYAADRASAEDPPYELAAAQERLLTYYLTTADAAGRRLIPQFLRLPRLRPDLSAHPDTATALAWLDVEWPNLTAAIELTARRGPSHYAWHLADALRAYFHHRGHRAEWLASATIALDAATAAGEAPAAAAMNLSIALACVNSGRYDEAAACLADALRSNEGGGWPEGEAAVLNNLSAVHQRLGAPQDAIDCGLRALRLFEAQQYPEGCAMALANVGFAYWQLGELEPAREHFGRALELAQRVGVAFSEAVLLVDLGNVHRDLGDVARAEDFYQRALAANQRLDYRYGEATALAGRALLRCMAGPDTRDPEVRADAERAVELTRLIGDRGTEAWTLNALGSVCLHLGAAAEARKYHRQALEIARETSFRWCEAAALAGLAEAVAGPGRRDEAEAHARQALDRAVHSGYRPIEAQARETLRRLALDGDGAKGV